MIKSLVSKIENNFHIKAFLLLETFIRTHSFYKVDV